MAEDDPTDEKELVFLKPKASPPVANLDAIPSPEICIICLELISNKATGLPCHHDHFDFACLGTWLQHQQVCPLCKREVHAVRYKTTEGKIATFHLSKDDQGTSRSSQQSLRDRIHLTRAGISRTRNNHNYQFVKELPREDRSLSFRRQVYVQNTYSLHVGANPYSGYLPSGSIGPDLFTRSPEYLSRARAFVRRELRVFEFLDPDSGDFSLAEPGQSQLPCRNKS
jgi:Ring finger domain